MKVYKIPVPIMDPKSEQNVLFLPKKRNERPSSLRRAFVTLLLLVLIALSAALFAMGVVRLAGQKHVILATMPEEKSEFDPATLFSEPEGKGHKSAPKDVLVVGQEKSKMDPKELAKEVLEILGKVVTDSDVVQRWLGKLERLGSYMDVISSVLNLISPVKDPFQEKFAKELEDMNEGINDIRRDVKALKDDLALEFEKAKIDSYLQQISMAVYLAKEGSHEELRRHCTKVIVNNTYDTLDCFEPLKIVTEKAPALLDAFYYATRGDLPKLSGVTSRLLGLVLAGEIIVQNLAKELPDGNRYDVGKRLSTYVTTMKDSFHNVTKRCIDQFEQNMGEDIEHALGFHINNAQTLDYLAVKLRLKYGWRHLGILIYDDVYGGDNHWNWGEHFVSIYHINGKNAAVYYRDKSHSNATVKDTCNLPNFQYFVACNDGLYRADDLSHWTVGSDFDYWKKHGECEGMHNAIECKERGKTICNNHFGFCDRLYGLAFVHNSANMVYDIDKEMNANVVKGREDYKYASTGIAFPL